MRHKNNTSTFESEAREAILENDPAVISRLVEFEVEQGRTLLEVHKQLFTLGAQVPGVDNRTFERKNPAALEAALTAFGVQWRYNTRKSAAELNRGDGWERLDDFDDAELRERIGDTFTYQTTRGPVPLHFGRERWVSCLNALLFHVKVDPFERWLETLPGWDETPRLDHYLGDLFTVDDSDLTQWAGAFLLLGPIERCYEPGAKLDEMPVFVGDQGIGKSTLIRSMLPRKNRTGSPMGCT